MQSGDARRVSLAALRRTLKVEPVNTVQARRRIAEAVSRTRGYIFS
jgi:hypothetical protein